jgi:hypothetical protein
MIKSGDFPLDQAKLLMDDDPPVSSNMAIGKSTKNWSFEWENQL